AEYLYRHLGRRLTRDKHIQGMRAQLGRQVGAHLKADGRLAGRYVADGQIGCGADHRGTGEANAVDDERATLATADGVGVDTVNDGTLGRLRRDGKQIAGGVVDEVQRGAVV